MKKLSDFKNPEDRQNIFNRIDQRWRQLYELEKQWGEEAFKFLFLINSGGSIAMLSFIGAFSGGTNKIYLKVALGFFVAGVILVGICLARTVHQMNYLFRSYRIDVNKFLSNEICRETLEERDEKRTAPSCWKTFWSNFWPYSAFACFIGGSIIGGIALF